MDPTSTAFAMAGLGATAIRQRRRAYSTALKTHKNNSIAHLINVGAG
jgi:hypothetical protein